MAVRHRRDRAIAKSLLAAGVLPVDPNANPTARANQVFSWWQALTNQGTPGTPGALGEAPGFSLDHGCSLGAGLLSLLGLVIGAVTAGAALAYDGQHPVNLVALLTLLVGLPALLLLFSILLLPGRIPGFGWLQTALAQLNVGHWLSMWLNGRLQERDFGWLQARQSGTQRVGKWLMLWLSQFFTLGFFAGAVLALLALVTFSDIAFGWASTLAPNMDAIVTWVQAAATPWAGWLPEAAPSAELIRSSQYFRGEAPAAPLSVLGTWWPYVMMCLLVYGLLPRVVFFLLCRWRLGVAQRHWLTADPQVKQLLQRMATPVVEHRISAPETDIGTAANVDVADTVAVPQGELGIVLWNDVLDLEAAAELTQQQAFTSPLPPLRLGSALSLADEAMMLENALPLVQHFVIVTKGWEPPLLEFQDFLQRLVTLMTPGSQLLVYPLGVPGTALSEQDHWVWQQAVAGLQHPQIVMVQSNAGAEAARA